MTSSTRPEIFPFLVSVVAIIGIIVLTMAGHVVPDILNVVAGGALVGGAAISSPGKPPVPPAA